MNLLKHKHSLLIVVFSLIGVAALLGTFQLGLAVGYRKADFSARAGEGFYKVFGPDRGMAQSADHNAFFDESMFGGHGAVGRVVSVALPNVVVAGSDNMERMVMVSNGTEIRFSRGVVASTTISPDDRVIVLGAPQPDGRVQARFIRILDR